MTDPVLREPAPARFARHMDLVLFMGCFLAGVAIYVGGRVFDATQFLTTGVLLVIMLLYAALASQTPRLRVRLDQAGDNAYYLGLLFTLTSMAVALYLFSVTAGAEARKQIIGNFGIALATTVMGIFLRILLHQMRTDPADVEAMARLELAEAATQMKLELNRISRSSAVVLEEMRQRAEDHAHSMMDKSSAAMEHIVAGAQAAGEALVERTGRIGEELLSAGTTAAAQLMQVSTAFGTVAAEADDTARRLSELQILPPGTAQELAAAASDVATLVTDLGSLRAQMTTILELAQGTHETMGLAGTGMAETIASASTQHELAVTNLASATALVTQAAEQVSVQLAAAGETGADRMAASVGQMEKAVGRIYATLEAMGTKYEDHERRMEASHQSMSNALAAAELSEAAARKVVDSLVLVTTRLTDLLTRTAR